MVSDREMQMKEGHGNNWKPVPLPCDLDTWPHLQTALARLNHVTHTAELIMVLDRAHGLVHGSVPRDSKGAGRSGRSAYLGLVHYLDDVATNEERAEFFQRTLPVIVNLALSLRDLMPKGGFFISEQQRGGETKLSRRCVASLLAHHFLCTLPNAANPNLNHLNFRRFFYEIESARVENYQTAKLRCILHYFDRIGNTQGPNGNLVFTRKVLAKPELPVLETWQASRLQLCPLVMRHGLIEETGSATLQVDFANRFIGGGALGGGCVQEEIRFCICPELLASLIFMECMEDNEAISVAGFEQFSRYRGYGTSLRFDGDFRDTAQISTDGDLKTMLVAIDATDMDEHGDSHHQYTGPALLRELNKAYIGFLQGGPLAADGTPEDLSESVYHDAVDHSLGSTEGEFETASEGLDSLSKHGTPCLSAIMDYSNSLSRAITDIAVKDYCQGKRSQYTQYEPPTEPTKKASSSRKREREYRNQKLDRYASEVAGDVLREGSGSASRKMVAEASRDDKNSKMADRVAVDGRGSAWGVDQLSEDMARDVVEGAMLSSQKGETGRKVSADKEERGHGDYPDGDADGISQSLNAIIDDIVCGVLREALAEIAGMCVSESVSTRDPSLSGYSVISTWSSKSDSFVRIDMDSEFSGSRSIGSLSSVNSERHGMSVEAYVSGVVVGAVQKMKGESSADESSQRTLVGMETGDSVSDSDTEAKPEVIQGKKVTYSSTMPGVSRDLDAYAGCITDSIFTEALAEVSGRPVGSHIYSQYSTIPSTPPPSPSNASTGSSKRFSLEDPTQLEEFAEKLLSSISLDPSSERQRDRGYGRDIGSRRLQEIEDFASNVVSKAMAESTHQVSSGQARRESGSDCISSRSSLTVPSMSSKRSSVDSFTEDLLKIGNIDPTGRRPSKAEENIAFFSQELAHVNEDEERHGQRRKSDLDDFQHELYQSSLNLNSSQKHEVTLSRIQAANKLAKRLSSDIICDAFLHLHGTTPFRELVRFDSVSDLESGGGSRRRSYPRRGNRTSSVSSASLSVRSTISEMDLMTLAANLANTIIESAMQTYRDEYLARQHLLAVESTLDDADSQMQDTLDEVSVMATYDGSTMVDQEEAIASMNDLSTELIPELNLQETASSIVEMAVQDAVVLYQASSGGQRGNGRRPVATGNWGCGAFGGDPQLKSVIQWLAASQCRAPSVFYCTMNDERIRQLELVCLKIQTKRWSVGDLVRIVVQYCHLLTTTGDAGSLFDYILGLQW